MSDPRPEGEDKSPGKLVSSEPKPEKKEGELESVRPSTGPEIDRVVESMPPEFRRIFRMAMMGFSSGPAPHPIFEKMNEEHIHKFLDHTQQDDEHQYMIRRSNRWFNLSYVVLGLGIFLFLIVYLLPDNKEILVDLLKLIVAFAGGLGSGIGLKVYLDRRRQG